MGRTAATGRLRIIGGTWRGRKLTVPGLAGLRPTPDRVRETLFNWLAPDIAGLRGLDLFAGSRALGFEALSRGALEMTFLGTQAEARKALRAGAEQLGAAPRILAQDALSFLAADNGRYDLVFIDPPFSANLWGTVLSVLPPRLAPGHRVYLESPADADPLPQAGWRVLKEGRAADVAFRLLAYAPDGSTANGEN